MDDSTRDVGPAAETIDRKGLPWRHSRDGRCLRRSCGKGEPMDCRRFPTERTSHPPKAVTRSGGQTCPGAAKFRTGVPKRTTGVTARRSSTKTPRAGHPEFPERQTTTLGPRVRGDDVRYLRGDDVRYLRGDDVLYLRGDDVRYLRGDDASCLRVDDARLVCRDDRRSTYADCANAASAAAMVAAMSSGLCAADTKPASNADGAR